MDPATAEAHVDGLRYTDLVAGYYLGASEATLSAIADFSIWFFAWDDRHDRDAVHGRRASWAGLCTGLRAALAAPWPHRHHEEPLVAAFADCLLRMGEPMGPAWRERFAAHLEPVIAAYDQEFDNRLSHTVPPVEEYIALRRQTFAHELWLDLLEVVAGQELPAHVRRHPAYRAAGIACQDFAAWYNDLCSLPKEIAGDEVHNLGISLIRYEELDLESAVHAVRERVAERVTVFLEAEKRVRQLADSLAAGGGSEGAALRNAVLSCVGNMRNWFPAVYWFHHESGRYRVEHWTDPGMPPYVSDALPAQRTGEASPPRTASEPGAPEDAEAPATEKRRES